MTAHDHWTFGPVADRVGIILVGLVMLSPCIWVLVQTWRDGRNDRSRRKHSGVSDD
jgi:hypothetical protein